MIWVAFALLARFLWAASTAVDQMISRSHRDAPIRSAAILYFLSALPCALLALAWSQDFRLDTPALPWIVLSACASVIAIVPYYKCLQKDDVHNLVPLLQLTPIYLTLLAFIVNGEVMAMHHIAGAAIVIICGFAFTWDFQKGHMKLRTFALMSMSSVLYALYQFSIRMASDHMDAWGVGGSIILVEVLIAFTIFLTYPRVRRSIITTAIATKGRSIGIAMLASGFGLLGTVFISMAFIHAPTTGHVAALGPTMPFFSFFIAAILGYVLTKHYSKVSFDRETKIKLLLLIGIFGGIYLLVMG